MLIQRISLLNFLSYRGTQDSTGKFSPVEIDLRSAPLWLIYGTNGSGKSSIFDAITFALFKEHRGSGTENRAASFLISDSTDQASIELEIFLNNKPYLIQREIKRNKSSSGIVSEWNGNSWVAVKGTKNNIEDWVENNLRMSYKTFVSAVLLRQGEADTFLKAKPKDRKERLLEVLDLKFYKELGELAVSKRNNVRAEAKQIEQKFENLKKVSDKDIEEQKSLIDKTTDQYNRLQEQISLKDKELQNAKQTTQIQTEINRVEKERKSALSLIEREALIIANVKRFRELEKDIPALNRLQETCDRIGSYEEEIDDFQKKINIGETKLATLKQTINEKDKELSVSSKGRDKLVEQVDKAQSKKGELEKKVKNVLEIEKIEAQIKQLEFKKDTHNEIMKRASDLDKNRERYEILLKEVPILEDLEREGTNLINAKKEKANFESELDRIADAIKRAQSELVDAKKISTKLIKDKEKKENEYKNVFEEIRTSEKKITERKRIFSKKECPLCGAKVDLHTTHAKIHAELLQWEKELEEKRKEEVLSKNALNKASAESKTAMATSDKMEKNLSSYQTSRTVLENKVNSASEKIQETKLRLKRHESKAVEWKDETGELDSLKSEKILLEQNKKDWIRLEEARVDVEKTQIVLDTRQKDLRVLPNWTPKERNAIKTSFTEISESFQNLSAQLKEIENECQKKEKEIASLNKQCELTTQNIHNFQENLQRTEKQKATADSQYQKQLKSLPERLSLYPSLNEKNLVEKMKREHKSLVNAEDEDAKLKLARNSVAQLEGQLSQLKKQLADIPKEHRRAYEDVKDEVENLQSSAKKVQASLNSANQYLGEMKLSQREYNKYETSLEKIRGQLNLFEKLTVAFGRNGLQSQIVQEAQKRIKDAANTTLSHLSNGTWQIELEGDDDNDELEILAQDISQPGMPKRPFEYLSGGEKFRVAISLAVAIGQSISGGRTVDTLIIDEGFGSLDEISRDNLVKELRRLSENVLNGGRVVIVSHQEDICEEFMHRIKVYKDSNGAAKVEVNP